MGGGSSSPPDKEKHGDAEGEEGVSVCGPAGHSARSEHQWAPATERVGTSALCDTPLTAGQNPYGPFH